jgi:hypothetical protein
MTSLAKIRSKSPLTAIRNLKSVLARQGAIVATYRTYNGRKLGPYYRLAYRLGGRQRSLYLGKSKKILRQARRLLEKIQNSLKIHRALCHAIKTAQADLKRHMAQFRIDLLRVGLQLRGYSARGWRRFRRLRRAQFAPPVPHHGLRARILKLLSPFLPPMRGPKPQNCPFDYTVVQNPTHTACGLATWSF